MNHMKQEKQPKGHRRTELLERLLGIDDETKQLITLKDIQDEIGIILHVLEDQCGVLELAADELKSMKLKSGYDVNVFASCLQKIRNNIHDFEKLAGQSKDTYDAVSLASCG